MDSTKREPKLETIVKRLDRKQRLNLRDLFEAKIAGGKEGLRTALKEMLEKPAEPEQGRGRQKPTAYGGRIN